MAIAVYFFAYLARYLCINTVFIELKTFLNFMNKKKSSIIDNLKIIIDFDTVIYLTAVCGFDVHFIKDVIFYCCGVCRLNVK